MSKIVLVVSEGGRGSVLVTFLRLHAWEIGRRGCLVDFIVVSNSTVIFVDGDVGDVGCILERSADYLYGAHLA